MGAAAVRGGPGLRLHRRGHGRVHRRRPTDPDRLVLHGDEHPAAGGAPGHRGGHRARPGRAAAAGRRRASRCRWRRPTSRCAGTRSRRGLRRGPGRRASCPPAGASWRCASRGPARVRVDSGIAEGTVVGSDYDPMLAKVIAYGARPGRGAAPAGRRARRHGAARARHQHRLPAGAAGRPRRARRAPRHRAGRPPDRRRWPRPTCPTTSLGRRRRHALLDAGAAAARWSTRSTCPAAGGSASRPGPPAGRVAGHEPVEVRARGRAADAELVIGRRARRVRDPHHRRPPPHPGRRRPAGYAVARGDDGVLWLVARRPRLGGPRAGGPGGGRRGGHRRRRAGALADARHRDRRGGRRGPAGDGGPAARRRRGDEDGARPHRAGRRHGARAAGPPPARRSPRTPCCWWSSPACGAP